MNDVILNKTQSIQRCIQRARDEYRTSDNFSSDITRQDAAILNITRGCEQAIDLANHVIRSRKLGIPADSGSSFDLLASSGIISEHLASKLRKMIGFRNIAVHEYQRIEISIVEKIITETLDDLLKFSEIMIEEAR